MATATAPVIRQGLFLSRISWDSYVQMLHMLAENRVRTTYDRGDLEIMVISPEHERYKHLLGRLIEALTEELGLPIAGFGSMTCSRKKKKRGLEPDECYWIANEPKIRGKDSIDLNNDPPPDLALEIDISYSSLDRLAIYAALKVPEVWRFDGTTLTFYFLKKNQKGYTESKNSLSFPKLTAADVQGHLDLRGQMDENAIVRQFRSWVKQHLAAGNTSAS